MLSNAGSYCMFCLCYCLGGDLGPRATPGSYIPQLSYGHGVSTDLYSHPPSTAGSIEHPALDFSSVEGRYMC